MKVNNNNIRQWYLDFFFGRNRVKPLLPKTSNNNNCDTFQLSSKAKRAMLNANIEKIINSGEPLKDDNAALKNKEWRTNPNYRVPQRLFSSPEVTADREAALEKLRRGEEITEWESDLLRTFPDMKEGINREYEARNEGARVRLMNKISSALSEAGIELSEDDELQFEVWGYDMTVTGNISDDKLELVKETLSDYAHDLQYIYQISGHSDEANAGGLSLAYLQSAEKFLKEAGGGSVFDIGKDGNGNFTGLPGDLGEFIRKNAKGTFGIGTEVYQDRNSDVKRALFMREVFNSAIKTVKNGDYDRLKSMTCKLTYKNGIISC